MKATYLTTFASQLTFIRGLEDKYTKAIKDYASSDYYEHLNTTMSERLPLTGLYEETYKNLIKTFTMVPRLSQPLVVWRGIRAQELSLGRLERQFVSTSLSLDSALREEFTGRLCCVLKITVPSGAQVLPIEEIAEQAGEFEVLLPPDGTWVVLSAEEVPYPSRSDWVKTYDLTYIPKIRVTITEGNPVETTRQLVKISEEEKIRRIVYMYDPEELKDFYEGNVEEYVRDLAKLIGALPMPPIQAIIAALET